MMLLCSLFLTLLMGCSSANTVLYGQEACTQFCNEKGWRDGDWVGTAPFCDGSCSAEARDNGGCQNLWACTTGTDKYRISHGCLVGSRSCCCKEKTIDCAGEWTPNVLDCNTTFKVTQNAEHGGKACNWADGTVTRLDGCVDGPTPEPTVWVTEEPTPSPKELPPTPLPTKNPTKNPTKSPTEEEVACEDIMDRKQCKQSPTCKYTKGSGCSTFVPTPCADLSKKDCRKGRKNKNRCKLTKTKVNGKKMKICADK